MTSTRAFTYHEGPVHSISSSHGCRKNTGSLSVGLSRVATYCGNPSDSEGDPGRQHGHVCGSVNQKLGPPDPAVTSGIAGIPAGTSGEYLRISTVVSFRDIRSLPRGPGQSGQFRRLSLVVWAIAGGPLALLQHQCTKSTALHTSP